MDPEHKPHRPHKPHAHSDKERRQKWSFYSMLVLSTTFCLIEFFVGYVSHSMALVADSFHMLSDVLSLSIGLLSLKYSSNKSNRETMTFGWTRIEVIGAFTNCVFLLSLCTNIINEAIIRMVHREHITEPKMVLAVGSIGLAINLAGFAIFETNSGCSIFKRICCCGGRKKSYIRLSKCDESHKDTDSLCSHSSLAHTHDHSHSDGQMNIRGVLLHIIGDAMGSMVVIVSTVVYLFNKNHAWTMLIDPVMSIILTAIILYSTRPLFKASKDILLMNPYNTFGKNKIEEMKLELQEKFPSITGFGQISVWQLNGTITVCTAIIHFENIKDWVVDSKSIIEYFHTNNIHSTTVSPLVRSDSLNSD